MTKIFFIIQNNVVEQILLWLTIFILLILTILNMRNNLKAKLFFKILFHNFINSPIIYTVLIIAFLFLLILSKFISYHEIAGILCGSILSILSSLWMLETINQYKNEIKYSGLMHNIANYYSKNSLLNRLKKLIGLFYDKEDLSSINNLNDLNEYLKSKQEQLIIPKEKILKSVLQKFLGIDYRYNFYTFPSDLSIKIGEESILNLYQEKDKLLYIINTNYKNKKNELYNCLKQIIRYSKQIVEFFDNDYGYMTTLLKLSIQIFEKE